jgi:hypothetical protein
VEWNRKADQNPPRVVAPIGEEEEEKEEKEEEAKEEEEVPVQLLGVHEQHWFSRYISLMFYAIS